MRRALTAVSLLLSGCATPMVKSEAPSTAAPSHSRLLGEYGLAQSVFTVSITRAGGDTSGDADAKTPSVVVTNTVNASPPAETPRAAEPPKLPASEAAWCDELRKSYAQDRIATLAFSQRHGAFLAKLDGWIAKGSYTAAEQAQVRKAIDDYLAADRANQEAISRAKRNVDLMRQDREGATEDDNPLCPQRIKVEIKETVEVANAGAYRLYAAVDNFSADHWTADFEGGFPKSVSGVADHKLGEIAVAGAKSIASIQALGVGPTLPTSLVAGRDEEALKEALKAVRRPHLRADDLQRLRDALPVRSERLPPIDIPLPIQKTYTLRDLEDDVVFVHDTLPVALVTDCSRRAETAKAPILGVAVSSSRACELTILSRADYATAKKAKAAAPDKPLVLQPTQPVQARAKIWALDSRYVTTLPLDRTMLVKTSTAYTFTAGRATKSDYDRPAPAMEVASLPFKVIGGFAGAFMDGVKGKTAQVQARTDLTKAHTAEIQAAEALAKARKDAAPAPTTGSDTPSM